MEMASKKVQTLGLPKDTGEEKWKCDDGKSED